MTDARALGFDPARLARIGPFMDKAFVENRKIPMSQMLVARNGQEVYRHQSGIARADGTALRDDAIFRIASMPSRSPRSRS